MFERRLEPLLPFRRFLWRLLRSGGLMVALVAAALSVGVAGYRGLAHLSWIDALLNASMILAGMGPVNELHSDAAKLFASGYALFSGVVFITSIGLVGAPLVHRFLHAFHQEQKTRARD